MLDKDGTITAETGRFEPEPLPLPGAWEALRVLRGLGVELAVVTNQGWVARRAATVDEVVAANRRLTESLARVSVRLLGVFFCPHHPDGTHPIFGGECSCRKPKPGLVLAACAAAGVHPAHCLVVGDKLSDVEAGHRAGALAALVLTGYGVRERRLAPASGIGTRDGCPDLVTRDVLRLARFLETLLKGGR